MFSLGNRQALPHGQVPRAVFPFFSHLRNWENGPLPFRVVIHPHHLQCLSDMGTVLSNSLAIHCSQLPDTVYTITNPASQVWQLRSGKVKRCRWD